MSQHTLCKKRLQFASERVSEPLRQLTEKASGIKNLGPLVREAFSNPIDFPNISDAIIPEDSIAIAIGENVPNGTEIALTVANHLVDLGHKPSSISIVSSRKVNSDDWQIEWHDPTDSQLMAYLCLDAEGRPYYVNRRLFDADVVIPIGNSDGQPREDSISPGFCDLETQKLLAKLRPADLQAAQRLIGHNLGVFWQVQAIAGPEDSVLTIFAGQNDPLFETAERVGREAWQIVDDDPSAISVVTIEADECQNWKNIRRAILAADRVTQPEGPIVVCCDISRKPPSWWSMGEQGHGGGDEALADVFQHRHLYLASQLSQESTEQVGFGYIEASEQLQKLIDGFDSVTLLREGHKVRFSQAAAHSS